MSVEVYWYRDEWWPVFKLEHVDTAPEYMKQDRKIVVSEELFARYTKVMADMDAMQEELSAFAK